MKLFTKKFSALALATFGFLVFRLRVLCDVCIRQYHDCRRRSRASQRHGPHAVYDSRQRRSQHELRQRHGDRPNRYLICESIDAFGDTDDSRLDVAR